MPESKVFAATKYSTVKVLSNKKVPENNMLKALPFHRNLLETKD
jgi:hypothetical protein